MIKFIYLTILELEFSYLNKLKPKYCEGFFFIAESLNNLILRI